MTAYLIKHPPRIRQFRARGTTPSGVVVVHTAESAPDWIGADAGAEQVARFIQNRTTYGSYHDLCDSDSIVQLVPYDQQAYGDGTGSNPHAYHVSAATQAAKWNRATPAWREATVRNMAKAAARYARWLKAEHGITIPARKITRAQSDARVPGFLAHGDRDPSRRTDPGESFPWDEFLAEYAAQMGTTTKEKPVTLDEINAAIAELSFDEKVQVADRAVRSARAAVARSDKPKALTNRRKEYHLKRAVSRLRSVPGWEGTRR